MKIILLDGAVINDFSDIHNKFKSQLNFPDYYGENLDALYDMLTDISEKIIIISVNSKLFEEKFTKKWSAFLRLMKDVEEEKENFSFIISK